MIKQKINLKRRDWTIYVYYNLTSKHLEDIINVLHKSNFPSSYITSAYTILSENKFNSGFTYSNVRNKTSVVGITHTTNASEFINSFVHEISHVSNHIATTYNIDTNSEEICYISGDIAQEMFKCCHSLMCDCCRSK